jgi:anti-sigma28 factor (negative regulator of flagellin synthesis)
MRITYGPHSGIEPARPKRDATPPTSSSKSLGKKEDIGDTFSASRTALAHRLEDTPSVRDAKVQEIRSQVESNSYRPSSEAVADGLIRAHLRRTGS